MSHMKPIWYQSEAWLVETHDGDFICDDVRGEEGEVIDPDYYTEKVEVRRHLEVFRPYLPEGFSPDVEINRAECKKGWVAYLSAPGYLDRTDAELFETEEKMIDYFVQDLEVDQHGWCHADVAFPADLTNRQIFEGDYSRYVVTMNGKEEEAVYTEEEADKLYEDLRELDYCKELYITRIDPDGCRDVIRTLEE